MRLFQNSGLYPAYLPRLDRLAAQAGATTFAARMRTFLADGFGAAHFLEPVLTGEPTAFLANSDDQVAQRMWALENGLRADAGAQDILLAQIENHRTEVFYNIDPTRYPPDFVKRLPGCVRHKLAWRAAPSPNADLRDYDRVVCNFPSLIEAYRKLGWKADYFFPAHDPAMDAYSAESDRPIDVVFVGGYTRHHRRRAELLEAVAALSTDVQVHLHLDCSRATRLAESWMGRLLPLARHRRPKVIRDRARPPIFGREVSSTLARSRIVLNGAIDLAGRDRGNMRCFEALGLGCLLLSDAGNYPEGMVPDETIVTYDSTADAIVKLQQLLADGARTASIARAGNAMVRERYSKARQMACFEQLLAASAT